MYVKRSVAARPRWTNCLTVEDDPKLCKHVWDGGKHSVRPRHKIELVLVHNEHPYTVLAKLCVLIISLSSRLLLLLLLLLLFFRLLLLLLLQLLLLLLLLLVVVVVVLARIVLRCVMRSLRVSWLGHGCGVV